MDAPLQLPVTAAGVLAAALAVVAGGPMFAAGLAALRGRRAAREIESAPLRPGLRGSALVSGPVRLESPLFAPLSQRACAGFVLEVTAPGSRVAGRIEDRRAFRIAGDGVEAHVAAESAEWWPEVTGERIVEAGEALPERLELLLQGVPETRWLRARGALRIVERALLPAADVWVAGHVRRARPAEAVVERVLAATGTDDAAAVMIEASGQGEPALWIEPCEALPLRVCGRRPDLLADAPPAWRVALAAAGPIVSLAGLLHLARALDRGLGGRF